MASRSCQCHGNKSILIAGMDNYVELWQPDAWRERDHILAAEVEDQDFFASLHI